VSPLSCIYFSLPRASRRSSTIPGRIPPKGPPFFSSTRKAVGSPSKNFLEHTFFFLTLVDSALFGTLGVRVHLVWSFLITHPGGRPLFFPLGKKHPPVLILPVVSDPPFNRRGGSRAPPNSLAKGPGRPLFSPPQLSVFRQTYDF